MASKTANQPSTGASELSQAAIDVRSLRSDAKSELMDILDIEASKAEDSVAEMDSDSATGTAGPIAKNCLVLDPRLSGALTLIVTEGPKLFKKHGVQDMVELSWFPLDTSCVNVMYLVRPEIESMKQVRLRICWMYFFLGLLPWLLSCISPLPLPPL